MPHIENGWQAWYCSHSDTHTYPSQCGRWPSLLGSVGSWVAPASLHSSGCISSLGSTGGESVGTLINQCQHIYVFESPLPLGALELIAFSHPWTYQFSYVYPPPALVPWFCQSSGRTSHRSVQTSSSHGTFSSLMSHHKGPHHGYLSRLGVHGSAFTPLVAERCVLYRQGYPP